MTSKKNTPDGFSILLDFSHEIRNPLNGINGMVDILLDTNLNPDQQSMVKNIDKKSKQLNVILKLILDYSKLTNGKIKYSPEQVFIYPYLQKELDKVFKHFRKQRIKFCYYIPPQLSGIAVFDPFILTQIIELSSLNLPKTQINSKLDLNVSLDMDLISFKYNLFYTKVEEDEDQNSQIASLLLEKYLEMINGNLHLTEVSNSKIIEIKIPIKCSPVNVSVPSLPKDNELKGKNIIFFNYQNDSCKSTSRYLEYLGINLFREVKDFREISSVSIDEKYDLIGIDISQLSKHEFQIMDDIRHFSQLPIVMFKEFDKSNEKVLTLQKDVVVMYKPVSPNNLSFVLQSVLKNEADQLREWVKNPISVLADYHNRLKILIADDESINQRVLKEYLNKLHLTADFVNNGEKALELYKTNKYDLIFMDIQMPVMNGVEAAEKIRNIKNNHHPYIVAITADALKGGKQKYLDAGMNDYLFKPVNLEGITKMIQKYIDLFKH